jgi:hypothetical protein
VNKTAAAVLVLVLAGLMAALTRPAASAPPTRLVETQATWFSSVKNQPTPGTTTLANTRLRITSTPPGYQVCLFLEVSTQKNSPRSDRAQVSTESGCVSGAPLTAADDLSTATLTETAIPLALQVRTCPPETPGDCSVENVPSRTVTTAATWTANEPLFSVCNGSVLVDIRGATATATLDGTPLGTSKGDNETNYIHRYTKTRC